MNQPNETAIPPNTNKEPLPGLGAAMQAQEEWEAGQTSRVRARGGRVRI